MFSSIGSAKLCLSHTVLTACQFRVVSPVYWPPIRLHLFSIVLFQGKLCAGSFLMTYAYTGCFSSSNECFAQRYFALTQYSTPLAKLLYLSIV